MSLERLTPAASMHLKGADRQNLGVLVLVTPGEHGPPTIEQVRTHVLARLDRVRRLRQRLQPVPGRIALPVWIDDENFDIRRHVVPLGVPAPVSTEVVEILAAGLVQQRIDLARPPWSLTYIPELDTGQFGFVLRADHVLGSGVTAAGMFAGTAVRPRARTAHQRPSHLAASPAAHTARTGRRRASRSCYRGVGARPARGPGRQGR